MKEQGVPKTHARIVKPHHFVVQGEFFDPCPERPETIVVPEDIVNPSALELHGKALHPQQRRMDRGVLGGMHAPPEIESVTVQYQRVDPLQMPFHPPQQLLGVGSGGKHMKIGDNQSLSQGRYDKQSGPRRRLREMPSGKIPPLPLRSVPEILPLMSTRTENACLKGAEFSNVDLGNARFENVNLGASRFADVSFAGAKLEDVSLSGTTISDANCSGMTIENACYEHMTIDGILVTELLRVYRELQAEGSDEPLTAP